jgi:hypothetical protein
MMVVSLPITCAATMQLASVGPSSPLPIRLDVEEPLSVGADRIVNTLAARELYHWDTIAVDLGTATTFDCISGDGVSGHRFNASKSVAAAASRSPVGVAASADRSVSAVRSRQELASMPAS